MEQLPALIAQEQQRGRMAVRFLNKVRARPRRLECTQYDARQVSVSLEASGRRIEVGICVWHAQKRQPSCAWRSDSPQGGGT